MRVVRTGAGSSSSSSSSESSSSSSSSSSSLSLSGVFDREAEARLEHWAAEQARVRAMRGVLLALNVSAPDGRQLGLKLRQGDQHELGRVVFI